MTPDGGTISGDPPTSQEETGSVISDYLLSVSNLTVRTGSFAVLENVSFKVREGTTLAIVGPNGAGKTTLFRALLKLVPFTGKIEWSKEVKMGYVPQHFSLTDVPISVGEFLTIKCKTGFEECLAAVELNDSQILKKRLNILSGGELQRVLIAWAIVDNPDVLLFDEPTANVDIGSEELVYQTLNKIEKEYGMTVLLISHELHVITAYSDSALALNKTVTYFGESKRLLDPELLAKIYGSGVILARHEH